MPTPSAHIAGVGVKFGGVSIDESTGVQAAVKALLDAGVTYGDVEHSLACFSDDGLRISTGCFDALGMKGAAVSVVDNSSGLFTAVQYIKSGQANCVLVLGIDREDATSSSEIAVVGIVLVSDLMLNSHAYLRDSAVRVAACCLTNRVHSRRSGTWDDSRTSRAVLQTALRQANLAVQYMQIVEIRGNLGAKAGQAIEGIRAKQSQSPKSVKFDGFAGWIGICGVVWQLRGWTHDKPVAQAKNCLLYTSNQSGPTSVVILSRSDDRVASAWKDVRDVREGRERLGYNPAVEAREVSREDVDNVRAPEEFTSDHAIKQLRLSVKGGDRAALARL